jgi:hypothetical protein
LKSVEPEDALVGFLDGNRELGDEHRSALGPTGGSIVRGDRRSRVLQLPRKPAAQSIVRQGSAEGHDSNRKSIRPVSHLLGRHGANRCRRHAGLPQDAQYSRSRRKSPSLPIDNRIPNPPIAKSATVSRSVDRKFVNLFHPAYAEIPGHPELKAFVFDYFKKLSAN